MQSLKGLAKSSDMLTQPPLPPMSESNFKDIPHRKWWVCFVWLLVSYSLKVKIFLPSDTCPHFSMMVPLENTHWHQFHVLKFTSRNEPNRSLGPGAFASQLFTWEGRCSLHGKFRGVPEVDINTSTQALARCEPDLNSDCGAAWKPRGGSR